MDQLGRRRTNLVVGRPVLVVIDIQRDVVLPSDVSGIARAEGQKEVIANAERIVEAARVASVPIIFTQEVHRSTGVDFGRELDGDESVHCLEGALTTELWPTLAPRIEANVHEYLITKRRYSAFFGTDMEILLRGLGAETLILIGNLTDVCVHYTFVDAHQFDYHVRVIVDCVCGSSIARHEAALDAMEYLQHGAMRTTEALMETFSSLSSSTSELTEVGT